MRFDPDFSGFEDFDLSGELPSEFIDVDDELIPVEGSDIFLEDRFARADEFDPLEFERMVEAQIEALKERVRGDMPDDDWLDDKIRGV